MITKIFNTRNNRKVGDESEQVNHDRSEDLDTDLNMEIDSQANIRDVTMTNINGELKEPGSLRDLEKMVESSQDIGFGGFSFLFYIRLQSFFFRFLLVFFCYLFFSNLFFFRFFRRSCRNSFLVFSFFQNFQLFFFSFLGTNTIRTDNAD